MDKTKKEQYKTVLVIATGLLIIFVLTASKACLFSAIGVLVLSLISTRLTELIHKFWYGLAGLLGLVMPKILLTLVYFLVLTPLAIIRRLLASNDPMMLKAPQNSTFRERNKTYESSDHENPW